MGLALRTPYPRGDDLASAYRIYIISANLATLVLLLPVVRVSPERLAHYIPFFFILRESGDNAMKGATERTR